MAAPHFVPTAPVDEPRSYRSPDHVPAAWMPDRPAELTGRQPQGARLGFQGPDQGYGLTLANRFRSRLVLPVVHAHRVAAFGRQRRSRRADAAASASDDQDLVHGPHITPGWFPRATCHGQVTPLPRSVPRRSAHRPRRRRSRRQPAAGGRRSDARHRRDIAATERISMVVMKGERVRRVDLFEAANNPLQ